MEEEEEERFFCTVFFFSYVRRPDEGRSKQNSDYLTISPHASHIFFHSNPVFQTALSYQRSQSHTGLSQQQRNFILSKAIKPQKKTEDIPCHLSYFTMNSCSHVQICQTTLTNLRATILIASPLHFFRLQASK